MQPARIIVHADATPAGLARAQTAGLLASQFGGRSECVVLSYTPSAQGAKSGTEATVSAVAKLVDATEVLRVRFERARIDAATLFRTGDIVLIGPPTPDSNYTSEDVFHAALFMSGRPCIVIPPVASPVSFGKRIVIAWKDCREAARALQDAMPFLKRAETVVVVSVKPEWDTTFAGQKSLDRALDALKAHGVKVERVLIEPGPTFEALRGALRSCGADMLVMGGYGRDRFSEFLFGGVTRDMLDDLPCPTLMSH